MKVEFGSIRNNVRSRSTIGDHIVDSAIAGDMLAEKFDAIPHEHHRIQSGPAAVRGNRRMGSYAMKKEPGVVCSQHAPVHNGIIVRRMPLQNHIDIAK